MSSETSSPTNPTSEQYDQGFRAGCLMGCGPTVLLGLFLLGTIILDIGLRESDDPDDGSVVIDLPEISALATEKNLLPVVSKTTKPPVYLGDDLTRVPLLSIASRKEAPSEQWKKRKARAVAVALHLEGKERDGYMKAVLRTRSDFAGLPFTMGDECRTTGDDASAFEKAADAVQRHQGAALLSDQESKSSEKARMAVASQVIPAESEANQRSLIRGLASIPHSEATRHLERLAVFSPEEAIRNAALEALAVRRSEGVTEVFEAGLRYPWPAVAENTATAIVRLNRTDLIPQLEAVLDMPDPRGPKKETVAGREESVAYELVRVNHLHNCLLCHPPIRQEDAEGVLSAEIPVPTMALPDTSFGYNRTGSNLLVRIDVTYLRQDFSTKLEVEDWTTKHWPKLQRFDFLLRRRVLSQAEADDLRKRLEGVSPYRRAAARALQELTGKDIHRPCGESL